MSLPSIVGIEYVLPNEFRWRENTAFIDAVNELLSGLTPYHGKSLTATELGALATHNTLIIAVDLRSEAHGHPIGIGRLVLPSGQPAEIHDLIVVPSFERRGIGTALVQRMITNAQHLKRLTVQMAIKPERTKARKLAESLGFTLVEDGEPNGPNTYRLTLANSPNRRTQQRIPTAHS